MRRFLVLMHRDTTTAEDTEAWGPYLASLRQSGRFEGGSSIGGAAAHRRGGEPAHARPWLVGYLMVQAEDLEAARASLRGNPVYEAGGTVELCELVED